MSPLSILKRERQLQALLVHHVSVLKQNRVQCRVGVRIAANAPLHPHGFVLRAPSVSLPPTLAREIESAIRAQTGRLHLAGGLRDRSRGKVGPERHEYG